MKTLILSKVHIKPLIAKVGLNKFMTLMIERLHNALLNFNDQQTIIPQRTGFNYKEPYPGVLEWMTVMQFGKSVHIKIVGYNPSNPELRKLPTILSNISVYDLQSGHLKAIVDGTFLTALRTGAASAVASRVLADPNSKNLGLIGCGAQAVTQLHALSILFDLKKVCIFDTDPAVSRSFLNRTAWLGLNINIKPLPELVAESDIICTATSVGVDEGPVFEDKGLQPWTHINAIGSDLPGKIEIPKQILKRSLVCPDFPSQAIVEGECQQLEKTEIGPSLAEIVKNSENYASFRQKLTVFDSTGYALEDQVAMDLLLELAEKWQVGELMEIECFDKDVHDPYAFVMPGNAGERSLFKQSNKAFDFELIES